ncbi:MULTISPECIES: hypothetical protein [Stenotrophomonas]|uniref:hypothetical protein n=1 Tax=Stenotrophomonas TaxID=40323 RepID=UPI00128F1635|nr:MULTISPECIES: hypothetical protein [Stenotrophomonas]MBN8791534.1 hypothetical protein [Stenotrophomonas nitritireducens]MBN8795473.1 hypothetical protein [Stenotrophomonas nitritireducens]
MNANIRRLHRAMALVLLAVLGGAMAGGAVAGPVTPPVPSSSSPSSRPPPVVAKAPPRCLKRSALGKCERRAPATGRRNPPAAPAATH